MVIALRILLDHNVPVGVRSFLVQHEVRTVIEMQWRPQIENGELLAAAEAACDVFLTSDQNIKHQQDLSRRGLALVVLGSNIWPIVREYAAQIVAPVAQATPSSYHFVEMPLPRKPQGRSSRT